MMLSNFRLHNVKLIQFEVGHWNDLTLTADKHLLNNESEMCVGPTAILSRKVELRNKEAN